MKKTIKERFESKFKEGKCSECWDWTAGKHRQGYGQFKLDGRQQLAHRFSYQLYIGGITDGLCVCHKCDNPACVNPSHLFLGTQNDNMHDCANKGRSFDSSGEKNGMSKLTEEDVRTIRTMYASGARQADIAREFGVSRSTIYLIVHNRHWTKL